MSLEPRTGKLDRLVSEWLSGLTCLDASKTTYIRVIRSWNSWLMLNKHYNAMGATRGDALEFRQDLVSGGKSPHTVCMYMSVLRMFHKFLYLHGDRPNITDGLRGIKRNKYFNKKPLSDSQVADLFGSLDISTEIGKRDRLILTLMVMAGLRCCEVSRINIGDYNMSRTGQVLRLQRKGHTSKDTEIPVNDEVRDAMSDYLAVRHGGKSSPLFISYNRTERKNRNERRLTPFVVEDIARRRMKAAGIYGQGYSAHSLRHTFGCMLVDKGVPMNQIQALMGHNSIDATMIYVKTAADRELFSRNPANLLKIPRKK